jgi:hypothetical protein
MKFVKPPVEELNIGEEVEGKHRFVTASHQGKDYRVRVPLHVWNMESEEKRAHFLKDYVRQLINKIRAQKP